MSTLCYARNATGVEGLERLCDRAGLVEKIGKSPTVVIKPNLVEALEPPVTTPVDLVEALVVYLQKRLCGRKIVVAEGCGARDYDTDHVFAHLGYTDMARRTGVELVDLNHEDLVELRHPECQRWPEMFLPRLVMDAFLVSVPVLKVHTLAGVTLSMKNMMGCAPPAHFQQGGHWKKAAFHDRVQEAVFDLNRYRCPDFVVLDAREGMCEAHLWGAKCEPPPRILAAGADPVAIDAFGCELLGVNWRDIRHIAMADGVLGRAGSEAAALP